MTSLSNEPRLGIDIGRVIITPGDDNIDTSFIGSNREAAMRTPPMPGAFEHIKMLVDHFGANNVWLVSKCGHRIRERSKSWLLRHAFWAKTGVSMNNIRFCRKRHEKAPICKELGITHFIDDRPDCLTPMEGIVEFRYLFGPQKPFKHRKFDPIAADMDRLLGLIHVQNWEDAFVEVGSTLGEA